LKYFAQKKDSDLFLVIDGHGQNGAEASEYIKQRFHTNLEQEL
jgi:serine/threonine protein phosphatase PrpC